MKVLISGASGLIGSALADSLSAGGHDVVRLVRTQQTARAGEIAWQPENRWIDAPRLEGIDAVVHLAGENIARRWTKRRKARIRESRVRGTTLLAEALARAGQKPRCLISASAIGYYGDRGDELLDERSEIGSGFLADVCRQWEQATRAAADGGIRVVNARFGVVLSKNGGALARMLLPFRVALGGRIGSGRQFISWIAIDDAVRVIQHAITNSTLAGPINAVAPNPVTNAEFTKALGRALSRPTVFPMPAAVARLAFGQMADEVLLSSARVRPERLLESGYQFRFAELAPALGHVLGKS